MLTGTRLLIKETRHVKKSRMKPGKEPHVAREPPVGHPALGLCALLIVDMNLRERCISRSLEIGNTFLILSYSKAK